MSTINANIVNNRKKQLGTRVIPKSTTPIKGAFVMLKNDIMVYKKVFIPTNDGLRYGVATLVIPAGTIVYKSDHRNNVANKCRAEKAIVIRVEDMEGNTVKRGFAMRTIGCPKDRTKYYNDQGGYRLIYKELTVVTPEYGYSFSSHACTSGIHFFLTKARAVSYT
jgi:hypothetical protein